MLTIYPDSELYQEIQRGNWQEESEVEKYREIRTLIERLDIPTQFAALGASNAFQLHGTLPQDKAALVAAIDQIIDRVGEEKLRDYRKNLPPSIGGSLCTLPEEPGRPPYEASSCIIQLTSGCTYQKCSFCNLYQDEPFALSPLSEFEEDLREIKA